jgi:hypothetical protein
MDDLIAFLNGRLDEDEASAKAAGGDTWRADDSGIYHEDAASRPGPFAVGPYEHLGEEGTHIARHDPVRALREVEAKRAILDGYLWVAARKADDGGIERNYQFRSGEVIALEIAVRQLAIIYSGHPDYRDEWQP